MKLIFFSIKILLVSYLVYIPFFSVGQDSLQISLLSCEPGKELYSTFGHSAIRVKNFTTGTDLIFNYGTFDFKVKNFYLKFMRGKLLYSLSVSSLDDFLYEYKYFNRAVYEQIFYLSQSQCHQINQFLRTNALPENKNYKYDFFWDNCSTRIRDILQNEHKSSLKYPDLNPKSFRDYLHDYLKDQPWSKFGIDLILGLPCDQLASAKEAMFLPLEMMKVYDNTTINNKAIASRSTIILPSYPENSKLTVFTPIIATLLLLGLTLFFIFIKKTSIFSTIFFTVVGLAGVIIFFLWFLSDHITTKNNLHLFWANPLFLLYPIRKKIFSSKIRSYFGWIYLVIILLYILIFPFKIQLMPVACIPIWISMIALFIYPKF